MNDIICIIDYDATWPIRFEQEKFRILHALSQDIVEIHHIGSTSVPGLAAKPIIDILIGLRSTLNSTQISKLSGLGYIYEGQVLGIPEHHFFRLGMPRTHHLHVAQPGSEFWERQILFRDFLRFHPDAVSQYAVLKRQLAIQFRGDRKNYAASKTPLIEELLAKARAWQQETKAWVNFE